MPNVRHEESLDGCTLPEITHPGPAYASNDQTLEDEQLSSFPKVMAMSANCNTEKTWKVRLDKSTFLLVVKGV